MSRRAVHRRDERLVVSYTRVSTEEQANKALSLPAQDEAIRSAAVQKGKEIVRCFVEPGVSGRGDDQNRPALREMLRFVLDPASKVSAILVYQTSRFMRDAGKARILKAKLKKAGIRVISVTQEVSDDPSGHLMEGIFESFDQYESEINGMRTASSMREAARRGFYPGGRPPYGFRSVRVDVGKGVERSRLEHEPREAQYLRDVFVMVGGGMGAVSVAREMNRTGRYYRKERPWTKDLVLRLTADPAAIGRVIWGRKEDEPIEIPVPPIVETELWEQVQYVRERRAQSKSPGRTNSSPLLLAGIVRCSRCRAAYQLETSGKLVTDGQYQYRYYNCRTACRIGKETCPGGRIAESVLDEAVLRHLADKLFNKDRCRELLHALVEESGVLRGKTDEERRRKRDELDDIERRIRTWELALEAGEITFDLVGRRLRELKDREEEVRDELARVRPLRPVPGELLDEGALGRFEEQIRGLFLGQDRSLAKAYLQLLVERIDTDGEQVVITARSAAVAEAVEEAQKPPGLTGGFSPTCRGGWLRKQDSNLRPIG